MTIDQHMVVACIFEQINKIIYTVLLVATFGYKTKDKKSAKLDDTSVTNVVLREATGDSHPMFFQTFRRITAVKLFNIGCPLALVDTKLQTAITKRVQKFVQQIEDMDSGEMWFNVRPLMEYSDRSVLSLKDKPVDVDVEDKKHRAKL